MSDAVEMRECWRLYSELQPDSVIATEWYERFGKLSSDAKNVAMRYLFHILESDGLPASLTCLDHTLVDGFLDAFSSGGLYKKINDESFEQALTDNPEFIRHVLAFGPLVKHFGDAIRNAMLAHKELSADLILDAVALDMSRPNNLALPKELTNADVCAILDTYCDFDQAHMNRLEVIANWSSSYGYSPDPHLRSKADKHAKTMGKELFRYPYSASTEFGIDIRLDPNQIPCKRVDVDRMMATYTFSAKWLGMYTDEATVLTNLIYVFELIDSAGLLEIGKPGHSLSTFMLTLMTRGKNDFLLEPNIKIRLSSLAGFVMAYEKFLLTKDTSLERAIDWFFNSYVEAEFGIKGFRCDMPSPFANYLSRCESICSQIERIIREYNLYARDGSIDQDLFSYEPFPPIEDIHSAIKDKYAYGNGSDYERFAFLLFSDQCLLACVSHLNHKANCLDRLIAENRITLDDYRGHFMKADLDWLIDSGFVFADESGRLALTNKGCLGRLLWHYGAIPISACDLNIRKDIDTGAKEGWIERGSTLLSKGEADIFNFVLTGRKFSNSLAIRNKYAHGAPPAENPNATEFENDYYLLLSLTLLLVLKMNHELLAVLGRVDLLEFVDWPLLEVGNSVEELLAGK